MAFVPKVPQAFPKREAAILSYTLLMITAEGRKNENDKR